MPKGNLTYGQIQHLRKPVLYALCKQGNAVCLFRAQEVFDVSPFNNNISVTTRRRIYDML